MSGAEARHVRFLDEAIAEAERGVQAGDGGPFGALVVRGGQVIGRGHNRVTSSCDPTAHAEVTAIRDACAREHVFSLDGAVIYSSCQPCPMCLAACYWARLDAVYFAATDTQAAAAGFDDARFHAELRLPPSERALPSFHVAHPRAGAPFDAWIALGERVDY